MSSQSITFGDKKVDKKEFYSSRQVISLNSVDTSKIIVSDKWKINDTTSKFFIGYLNEDVIKSLCIILPQMRRFIKYFESGAKNMSFMTEDKVIYLKYSEIWDKIKKLLKLKFSTDPIRDKNIL